MYIVLTQDVAQVGHKNAIVNVSQGFFMNYLLPRGLAQQATAQLVDRFQREQVEKKKSVQQSAHQASEAVQKLKDARITLSAKASDKGTLFRGITEKRVAKALEEQFGVAVDEGHITMDHFKSIGEHQAVVKFGNDTIEVKIVVEPLQ